MAVHMMVASEALGVSLMDGKSLLSENRQTHGMEKTIKMATQILLVLVPLAGLTFFIEEQLIAP